MHVVQVVRLHCTVNYNFVMLHLGVLLRLLRELRDKYLKAGGNFELPAETRKQMGITKLSKLSVDHLNTIQKVLTDALRSYW